ncbi:MULTISPECIES: hypothetical protein [unclassified Leucobacter]|uniref:hypothetical protein n=1 Tax=unclassified Leucobacter TaxID=2621730 RepID=UPI000620FDF0|nr:hypothetical protein [Leucobacter sp. Ag1]KKI16401.1 hypothetical protein XM48_16565 [Leucobacter sp. Ag1]
MVLKYAAKRPGDDLDGLQDLEEHFVEVSPEDVYAVVLIGAHTIVEDGNDGSRQASVRIKRIEPVSGADAETVRKLLDSHYAKRTGNTQLELEEPGTAEASELPVDGWGGEE